MKHKMLRRFQILMAGLVTLLIGTATAVAAQSAPPAIPSSFYGSVDGDLNEETVITAVVRNEAVAQTTLINNEGQWVYSIIVPGDNPNTLATIEGGSPGDPVEFLIDGQPAVQTAVWRSGRNTKLNLTTDTAPVNATALWLLGGFILVVLVALALYVLRRPSQLSTTLLPLQENKS